MTDTMRVARLRHILTERRREMQDQVTDRIRDGRAANRSNEGRDDIDVSNANIQGDMEFALLQMRTETLTRIKEALFLLDAGEYGLCVECDDEISERRLRALPFAVRCQACEERREQSQRRARQLDQQRGALSLFPDVVRA
jgi:RNA polymerase-binding transcription factor